MATTTTIFFDDITAKPCFKCEGTIFTPIGTFDHGCENCHHIQVDSRVQLVPESWLCTSCDDLKQSHTNGIGAHVGYHCPRCDDPSITRFLENRWNEENGYIDASCDDFGNAERLIARYGYRLKFLHDVERWLWWDDAAWGEVGTTFVEAKAKFTLQGLVPVSDDKWILVQGEEEAYPILPEEFRNPGRGERLLGTPNEKQIARASQAQKEADDTDDALLSLKRKGAAHIPKNRPHVDLAEAIAGAEWGEQQQSARAIKDTLSAVKADSRILDDESIFATRSRFFAVRNGVLETKEGRFVTATPDQNVTARAGARYDEAATCPEWESFVATNFPDAETRRYLQKLVGYSLTGEATQKSFWFFYSKCPDTGKSLFLKVWQALFGDYATSLSEGALKPGNGDGGRNPDLHAIMGKRLAAASEIRPDAPIDEARMKRLTSGGSDEISSRGNYSRANTVWTPQATIVIATNNLSRIDGGDEAVWSRVVVVPFTVAFPKGDPQRDEELGDRIVRNELSGVLNWALQGLEMYRDEGLIPSREIIEATAEYQAESDGVTQILTQLVEEGTLTLDQRDENNVWSGQIYEKASDLYRLFTETARSSRVVFDMTQKAFVEKLEADGYPYQKLSAGRDRGNRRVLGITINRNAVPY